MSRVNSGVKVVVGKKYADERQCLPACVAVPNAKTLGNWAFWPAFEARLPPCF